MSKLKILIGILAVLSLLFGQCMCPNRGSNPTGSFGSKDHNYPSYIIGNWQSTDASWSFVEGGELVIRTAEEVKTAQWSIEEGILEIANDNEIAIYTIENVTDTKLKLFNGNTNIELQR